MMIDVEQTELMRRIVAKSVMLFEKLELKSQWIQLEGDHSADKHLDMWAKVLSSDNEPEKLSQFRELAGLSILDTEFMLSPVVLRNEASLPAWANTLARVLNYFTETETVAGCLEKDNPIPFEELLLPFVADFQQRIAGCLGEERLSKECHQQIQRKLLQLLSDYTANTFYLEFQVFQTHNSSLVGNWNFVTENNSCKVYQQFIKEFCDRRHQDFFAEYAMVGRILGTLTNLWYEAIVEFLKRIDADWTELEATFNHGISLGEVNKIILSLSDRHCGGRSVIALSFKNGKKLVYKPKNLAMEAAFSQVLDWLNHQGKLSRQMKVMKVLDKNFYGWVEFIESVECRDEEELEAFYHRTGILLGLGYILEATDMHQENIIAHGAYPVLIDCETLLQHRANLQVTDQQHNTANSAAIEQLSNSVLRSHFLPDLVVGKDNSNIYDMSGLGSFAEQKLTYEKPQWKNINTDTMRLEQESHQILPIFPNIPRCNQTPVGYETYAQSIIGGFAEIYRLILTHRHELLKSDGLLSIFKHQEVRFVFRNTMVYGLTHRYMHQPKFMEEGVAYSIVLEQLARGHLFMEDKSPGNAILQAERKSMQELDIPYFTANVNDTALRFEGQEIVPDYFQAPSYLRMLELIREANEDDLFKQTTIIKQSLSARLMTGHQNGDILLVPDTDKEFALSFSKKEAIDQARHLASQIMRHSIRGVDGSITWIAPLYIQELQLYKVRLLPLHIYDGLTGIALFFAALYKVTEENQYRDTCYKILQTVRKQFREKTTRQDALKQMGHGIALGYSGIPYAFSQISYLLNDSVLRAESVDAVMTIDEISLSAEKNIDVFTGIPGACLALLEVFRSTKEEAVLHKARMCGEILLQRCEVNKQHQEKISEQNQRDIVIPNRKNKLISTTFYPSSFIPHRFADSSKHTEINWNDYMYAFAYGEAGIRQTLRRLALVTGEQRFIWLHDKEQTNKISLNEQFSRYTKPPIKSQQPACFMPGLFTGLAGCGYSLLRDRYAHLFPNIFLFE
jgi:type 2 lantibiotic biosynthesis protein LanM